MMAPLYSPSNLAERLNTPSGLTAAVAAVVALLQTTFTVIGTANGGLSAVIINDPLLAAAGLAAVVLGLLTLAIKAVTAPTSRNGWSVVAIVALLGGTVITAIAAFVFPTLPTGPVISASVVYGSPLRLDATITASGLGRQTPFDVEVQGLRQSRDLVFRPVSPVLYQGQSGPDRNGNVKVSLSVPIPQHKYSDVAVVAWSDNRQQPCSAYSKPRPEPPAQAGGQLLEGCVVIHIKGTSPTANSSKKS
jgi:hypothetical protein